MRTIKNFKDIGSNFDKWLVESFENSEREVFHGHTYYTPRERLICRDGFSLSIQGGRHAYSCPREDGVVFSEMEIGFPSGEEILLSDYREGDRLDLDSVFPYVPVEVIIEVIKKHGGFKK